MTFGTTLTLTLAISVLISTLPPQYPIIGVYTEDAEDFGQGIQDKQTYVAASYVKNLEMAGAQVVPLFYHSSKEDLQKLLGQLNGVLLPGGQMPIDRDNQWTSNIQTILDFAISQNDQGNPYPIWATCLSYEAILYLSSGNKDNMTVLTGIEGQHGLTGPLNIKNSNSVLIKALNQEQYKDVTTGEGILWFHQSWAILLKTFEENENINKFWKLVSTTVTHAGDEQVSTVQAHNYPFFMTQYHPQKNSFEWHINPTRSYNAISVEQKFINEFMKVARLNRNRMDEQVLKQKWIFNYEPIFPPADYYFTQIYLFDESKL